MLETPWLYLALNAFTVSVPLIRSFDSRVRFYTRFKALFLSIALVGAFFIIWDVLFTINGVWGFNPKYLSGINILHLPLGEWLFFITVPYACVFIYDVLNYFWPKAEYFEKHERNISVTLVFFSFAMVAARFDKLYTVTTFTLLGLFLAYLHYHLKPAWLPNFYRAYLVGIIGFFIVNGVLTGTGIEEEVVWYNDSQFTTVRIGTIPIEDMFYGLLLILMNITLYEYFIDRFKLPRTKK
jgi:lycopene cyclase domain-containing protein